MQHAHIRQLSADVIGQIAAGEVVERPSAAIKELVENSMDASATAITVEIRDGGLTSFRVVDNGSGIQPSDIRLAFARHATSKISTAQDLYGVQTLGFRGEALASIAAVAKVTCTTRMRGAENGVTVQNNGGELGEIKEAACPEGTAFLVKDLFFNAPVRRRFLKKPATETGYISDLMMRFILSHPQVSFRYIADGKTVYFSAGDGKLESAVMSIYGLQALERLRHVSGNMNGVALDGFVGVGDLSRGNRSHQSFILNGRLIKSNLLTLAVEEACKQRVMIGRYPMCILHLTMPFEAADVNVHPNKWEVRFQHEAEIREAVQSLVFDALQDRSPIADPESMFLDEKPDVPIAVKRVDPAKYKPDSTYDKAAVNNTDTISNNNKPYSEQIKAEVHLKSPAQFVSQPLVAHDSANGMPLAPADRASFSANAFSQKAEVRVKEALKDTASSQEVNQEPLQGSISSAANEIPTSIRQQEEPFSAASAVAEQTTIAPLEEKFDQIPVRLIGVVFDTYILLEASDRLLMCDQHAVHERLLYEQMMKAYAGDAASQQLLTPEMVHLTHREFEIFRAAKDLLYKAGFDASDFGDLTVQLRAVPMVLGQARSSECFRDALDDLAESGQISNEQRTSRIIQMACKHAVKGGERAPMSALMDLIRRMIRENVTPTCPHGRPLVIEISKRDLEKRFHRIQN